jgi:hypothetical protein
MPKLIMMSMYACDKEIKCVLSNIVLARASVLIVLNKKDLHPKVKADDIRTKLGTIDE